MEVVAGKEAANTDLTENNVETQEIQDKKHKPSNLFDTKEAYLAFRQQWSKLAAEKKLTAAMMVFYNAVRGKDLKRGFTPITNKNKLENGARADWGHHMAWFNLKYTLLPNNKVAEKEREAFIAMFDKTIDDEFITKVANYLV